MAESFSINGTPISTYLYSQRLLSGLVGLPPMRGADYDITDRVGVLPGRWWPGAKPITIGGVLYGNNGTVMVPTDARARFLDNARGLAALVYANGDVATYQRVIPSVAGDLTVVTSGRYLSGLDSIEQAAAHAGRVTIDLLLLDPFWYPAAATTLAAIAGSSSPTIAGDTRTRKVTLTFSGATGQRLTNNTTGDWVQIAGSATVDTVLDVAGKTATRGAVNVAGEVTHGTDQAYWLPLNAGVNSLTLTGGGTVTIAYQGAYL